MIYTAPCVRFLMRADTLGGEVGEVGWRWKSRVLWAPVNMHEPIFLQLNRQTDPGYIQIAHIAKFHFWEYINQIFVTVRRTANCFF